MANLLRYLSLLPLLAVCAVAQGNMDNMYTSDGPAELPRVLIDTRLSSTPSPLGTVAQISATNPSDLAAAYAALQCGQTLALPHGAPLQGSGVTFGPKNCDALHWITITSDGVLPAEGTRINPVTDLSQLAVLSMKSGAAPIVISGDHIRFIGVAFLKAVGGTHLTSFVETRGATNVIFDRVYMHGNPKEETTRSINMDATQYLSVIDSWLDEDHCIAATGTCTDAQTITSSGGTAPSGPYKIVNNYLQASGEGIMFGGGLATATPADIEIRGNHIYKPQIWNPKDPAFIGVKYIAKNGIELKNAKRVLIEGNVIDGSWGGFSQAGFAVVLTPKSQAGVNGANLCPLCVVTDVTIRYNLIQHVAGGFQIANVASDNGGNATDGQRYSIHDVLIDDLNGTTYNGTGSLAEIATGNGSPLLQNVVIDHVTAFPQHTLLTVGTLTTSPMKGFVFTNNLVSSGQYPVWSMGGGTVSCAFNDVPVSTIANCFKPGTFAGNVIAANLANYPATRWPVGNSIVTATGFDTNFVNFASGNGGDYHLAATSPYKGKGADIDLITKYTLGVN